MNISEPTTSPYGKVWNKITLLFITAVVLIGCKETPVEYYMCDRNSKECNVVARFDTLWACERYKIFAAAYCDSESVPGKIICDTAGESEDITSYCKKTSLSR